MADLYIVVPEQRYHVGEIDPDHYDESDHFDLEEEYDIPISNVITSVEFVFEIEETD